jgi:hypothetical protein
MPTAPTAREIIAKSASFDIDCDPCRLLTQREDIPPRLVAAGRGDTPIDRLRFKCRKCGMLGTPLVKLPGNGLMGRVQLWPVKAGTDAGRAD